jgi:hypothetical protein
MPVVDYEPPPLGVAACPPPTSAAPRRATPRRPAGQQLAGEPPSPHARAAGGFADAALRRVLEVLDRRRPVAQLRPLLAGGLVDSLLSLAAAQGRESAAVLRRVRVQSCSPSGEAAEVSATYSRGRRVHAIACRVEQVPTPNGVRWQVVALHIG